VIRLPVSAVLIGAFCAWQGAGRVPASSTRSLLQPAVVHDDFGGDGLGQWASYPPAQDVGYEPSLTPTAQYGAPGGRGLMRVVTPVTAGPLRIGFIKQVPLVASAGGKVEFSYRLEPPALAGEIEIGIAGGDGHRYTARQRASSGKWTSLDTALSAFRDSTGRTLADRTSIEAMYVIADISDARPDTTCRFLLDDVRLSASRLSGFDMRRPAAGRLDPWPALPSSQVLRPGSTITIEATAPVPLKQGTWTLTGPAREVIAKGTLHDDGSSGDRQAGDGVWSQAAAHRIGEQDPEGVWHLTLDGQTADGQRIETDVRLLNFPRRPAHPRLYFDSHSVERLRARRTHPAMKDLWATLRQSADASRTTGAIAHGGDVFALLDAQYLLPSLLGYFDVLNRARVRISSNAAVGFIDNDRSARAAARTALLEVAKWQTWTPPWFEAHGQHTYYPAGQLASAVALAYDVLYDDLSPSEQQLVRRALMERAILPTWREYVVDNRVMADTSNWISHTVGGAIIAAAAIAGDGSAEEDEALARPLNGLLMKIEDHMAASFLRDGSYGEGISYMEFDLETLGPMLHAVDRVFGQSYWNTTHVMEALRYPLHTLADPVSESLDMGDTHPPAGHAIGPLVARSTDPVIRWFGGRFKASSIFDFLFFDDSVAPRAPSVSGSRIFDAKGNAVFRTGWDAAAGLVLFRAGPTFNHNHADQGSFQFRAFGETLVTEAGWSDYYKDPYYDTFFTQAAGHNTLLVDGNPASQDIADTAQFAALDRRPRITDATLSSFYDAVGSELASVYRGRLQTYNRRLAYIKPDYLVLFDRVRANAPSPRLTLRLHVPAKSGLTVDTAGAMTTATYAGTHAALAIRPMASTRFRLNVGEGHIPYPVFASRTPEIVPPQPAYLDIATDQAADDAWFVVALVAGKDVAAATSAANGIRPVEAPGWTGFQTVSAPNREFVLFSTGSASRQAEWDGWRTDAESLTAAVAGSVVRRVGAQQVRTLRHDGRALVEADQRVSVALEYDDVGIAGVISADAASRVHIAAPRAPVRVTVGGKVVDAPYDAASASIVLSLPAGSSTLSVSWASGR
jgi:hypothetical protein